MAPEIDALLTEIRRYCARTGGRDTTLCKHAVGDARFVARLEAGGQCWPSTMAKIREYIADHPPPEPRPQGSPGQACPRAGKAGPGEPKAPAPEREAA